MPWSIAAPALACNTYILKPISVKEGNYIEYQQYSIYIIVTNNNNRQWGKGRSVPSLEGEGAGAGAGA